MTGGYFLWRAASAEVGLAFFGVAAVLFLAEAWLNTRHLAGIAATGALAFGAWKQHVAAYLAFPLSLAFGAVTIWLSAAAKRARRNKRAI